MSSPDDLASKANIIIDPAEIQTASMDDLDEDEESGATQVESVSTAEQHFGLMSVFFFNVLFLTLEAIWRSCGGRSSCSTQLVEFSHAGSNQPFSEYSRCQSDDTQTTSHTAGESKGPDAGSGTKNGG